MECRVTKVLLSSKQRAEYLRRLLRLDGLDVIKEIGDAAYAAVPLTGVPKKERSFIIREHEKIKICMSDAGIRIYDPKDAGMNPWSKIEDSPSDVYDLDSKRVLIARIFELTNLWPSTGGGIELHKAVSYLKMAVNVNKAGVYTSRMSTGARRIILMEYDDARKQRDEISGLFRTLKEYEVGVGICSAHGNTLLGYSDSQAPLCLPGLIAEQFPGLVYNFDKYITK